jgi:hypothetical protein
MTPLRLDPAHVPLWRDASTLQLGREGTVVLRDPAPWQERIVAELERGTERAHLERLAAALRVPREALDALLDRLSPVLRRSGDPRRVAVIAADRFPERAVGDVLDGLEGSGWEPSWVAPGEPPVAVRDGRIEPIPVVLLAAHAVAPHQWAPLQRADAPHLPLVFAGGRADVGPLVVPGRTACLGCLAAHERDRDPAWPALVTQLVARRPPDVALPLAIEAAALAARLLDEPVSDAAEDGRSRSVRIDAGLRRLWRSHRPHAGCLCRLLPSEAPRSRSGSATAGAPPVPNPATTTATAFARPA